MVGGSVPELSGNPADESVSAHTGDSGDAAGTEAALSGRDSRWLLRGVVVAVAIVVGLAAWLATRDSGGGTAPEAETEAAGRTVTPAGLGEASALLGQPVFWAGTMPETEMKLYELAEGGGVQVVYLPEGTGSEEPSGGSLTIGSYPLANPAAALQRIASGPAAMVRHSRDGREVVTTGDQPTSVYFADPTNRVQVEVYDPSAKRAMALAVSGKVVPAP